jgi:hypothetical protein
MRYLIFDKKTGEYWRTAVYSPNRVPDLVDFIAKEDTTENGLKVPENKRAVLVDDEIRFLNDEEFRAHRVKVCDLELKENEKLEDGKIVPLTKEELESKNQTQFIKESDPEKVFNYLYDSLSRKASKEILSGYKSNALGEEHIYDTELEDQFNIKSIKDMNIQAPIRCYNVKTKVKTFVNHSAEQIKKVHDGFALHKTAILQKVDEKKIALKKMFDSKKTNQELWDFVNG